MNVKKPIPGTLRSKLWSWKRPNINEDELVNFIGRMTELDDETIISVLNSELLFLKMKGVVK